MTTQEQIAYTAAKAEEYGASAQQCLQQHHQNAGARQAMLIELARLNKLLASEQAAAAKAAAKPAAPAPIPFTPPAPKG